MKIVLASKSSSRKALLDGANVPYEAVGSAVDEAALKTKMVQAGQSPADVAEALAIAKAEVVAKDGQLTIGGDQVLEFQGQLFDKPETLEEAGERLLAMAGKAHFLRSGIALFRGRECVWTYRETSTLTLRPLTRADVDAYFNAVGERVLATVGAYELEGPGVRLFERVEGDFFAILGLPLLPLLARLREEGALPW
ncbi:MAG: Maf family protein [Parvularcula sp.]